MTMAKGSGKLSVLVVDDNVDSAEMLQTLLERYDCHVRIAENGVGALAFCDAERPDLVFLDLGLPDIDGHEVGRRLREKYATATVRIVAVSGYGGAEHVLRSAQAGFDAHLTKPVETDAIVTELGRARTQGPRGAVSS
jgi:CheY-like chemotaxis protein